MNTSKFVGDLKLESGQEDFLKFSCSLGLMRPKSQSVCATLEFKYGYKLK